MLPLCRATVSNAKRDSTYIEPPVWSVAYYLQLWRDVIEPLASAIYRMADVIVAFLDRQYRALVNLRRLGVTTAATERSRRSGCLQDYLVVN